MRRRALCALLVFWGCDGRSTPATPDGAPVDAQPTLPDGAPADDAATLFPDRPECAFAAIVPRDGNHPMVVSRLAIAAEDDGFDLDGDGMPDNRMAAMGTLMRGAIQDGLESFTLLLPMEMFDHPGGDPDACVELAIYRGWFGVDADGDGHRTSVGGGDCDDGDALVHPGAPEIVDNRLDDDCDGRADETEAGPSSDATDADNDGVTIADGDCNDTAASGAAVHGPGAPEICGDGVDNDCDGVADRGHDAAMLPECSPYDETPEVLTIDPASLDASGRPITLFDSGATSLEAGMVTFRDDVAFLPLVLPVTVDFEPFALPITVGRAEAWLVETPGGKALMTARLGGVMEARRLDGEPAPLIPELGVLAGDSMLDLFYANPTLGVILNVPKGPDGCALADLDVDLDGIEAFCDTDPLDEVYRVDLCIDGDGEVFLDGDGGAARCTDLLDPDGAPRFPDGLSIAIELDTVPAAALE